MLYTGPYYQLPYSNSNSYVTLCLCGITHMCVRVMEALSEITRASRSWCKGQEESFGTGSKTMEEKLPLGKNTQKERVPPPLLNTTAEAIRQQQ